MTAREAVCRVVDAILPWPRRAQRKQVIVREQARADAARRRAEHARKVADELLRMAREDPLAEEIARQITEGRR